MLDDVYQGYLDVYQGYLDAGWGKDYPGDNILENKHKTNSDYALGIDLAKCSYFLSTADTSREYDSDTLKFNEVRDQINDLYPNSVLPVPEHCSSLVWQLRVFNIPELETSKRVKFIGDFIGERALPNERENFIYIAETAKWFKIKYFNFIEKPVSERVENDTSFRDSIKVINERYPKMLNPYLMDYALDYHVSQDKLLQVSTVFDFSQNGFLPDNALRLLNILPLEL